MTKNVKILTTSTITKDACVAIWDASHDLISSVQFKKSEKKTTM